MMNRQKLFEAFSGCHIHEEYQTQTIRSILWFLVSFCLACKYRVAWALVPAIRFVNFPGLNIHVLIPPGRSNGVSLLYTAIH